MDLAQSGQEINTTDDAKIADDKLIGTSPTEQPALPQQSVKSESMLKRIESLEIENKETKQKMMEFKQSVEVIKKENHALKQEMIEIKAQLTELATIGNIEEKKEEEVIDVLRDFLTNAMYKVNLEQYYTLMYEEGFDEIDSILVIKEVDLIDIGINKKGHRLKILNGIDILRRRDKNDNDKRFAPAAFAAPDDNVEGVNVINTNR